MTKPTNASSTPFEVHHGSSVVTIADDWSGHVLIEQIYDGLRRARRSRDSGQTPLMSPAPGSQAENSMIETALFHGFQQIDGTPMYRATTRQIITLMTMAREQGRIEAIQDTGPQD